MGQRGQSPDRLFIAEKRYHIPASARAILPMGRRHALSQGVATANIR
ncbi:MAG: hypothetical protein ABIG11_03905 [bacterium]